MSQRTTEAGFRRVDVDQYSEEGGGFFAAADAAELDDAASLAMTDAELSSLLSGGDAASALAALLAGAPVNARSQSVKDQALGQVLRVLMHIRGGSGIEACVAALPESLLDALMKYIYRGFEVITDNHAHLLAWHEKALARGQIGCVVRVLADRKRV